MRAIRGVTKPGKANALPWILCPAAHPAKASPRTAQVAQSIPSVFAGVDTLMQINQTPPDETELAMNDLGPLAWVLDELRKSLDGATKALRRFVRDAELARGSDLAELDASQLRIARQQLHQAVGAHEMVGLGAPAKLLRAMEALAQKFVQRPELCSDDAADRKSVV